MRLYFVKFTNKKACKVTNHTSCAQVHELPQRHCDDNWEGRLFSWFHIYYANLGFGRVLAPWVSRIIYGHLYYTPCFVCWRLLVHWFQQCVNVHYLPRCMSCHKAIVVITMRAHCFHDYIFIISCFGMVWALWVLSITYDHLNYAPCYVSLALLAHWHKQCLTIYQCFNMPMCMSCHKAIVVEGKLFSWLHTQSFMQNTFITFSLILFSVLTLKITV